MGSDIEINTDTGRVSGKVTRTWILFIDKNKDMDKDKRLNVDI
jgi:hypothetical protein